VVKAKSKVIVSVADGVGGMVPVEDRRFQKAWPISLEASASQAENWLTYLAAEAERWSWSWSGIEQLEAGENSGSVTLRDAQTGRAQVELIWSRERNGSLKVSAGCSQPSDTSLDAIRAFLQRVNADSSAAVIQSFFRVWHLRYTGLPWKGELWLGADLVLSAPSQQYEGALTGPRVIIVNCVVKAISETHATELFAITQRELAVFLSTVAGKYFDVSPNGGHTWTWAQGTDGKIDCEVKNLGYWETSFPSSMPTKGTLHDVPLEPIQRPDFEPRGIDGSTEELCLPADVVALWEKFEKLPPSKRRQFIEVGSLWQAALSVWAQYETMRFSLMVAACEALKPADSQFREHNIYDVVEALLGQPRVEQLRKLRFKPQDVRSAFLHTGALHGSEFVRHSFASGFKDPSFDEAGKLIALTTQAAIIAWLASDGEVTLPRVKRQPKWRRWTKRNGPILALAALGVGVILGFGLAQMMPHRRH
jgi:hypothetical protein